MEENHRYGHEAEDRITLCSCEFELLPRTLFPAEKNAMTRQCGKSKLAVCW